MKSFALVLEKDNEKEVSLQKMFVSGDKICFLNFKSATDKKTKKETFAIDFSTIEGIHYTVLFDSRSEFDNLRNYIESDELENPNLEFICNYVDGKQFMVSHFSY